MNKYQRSKTSTFNVSYHLIWCPKYRRKVLETDVSKRLKELLYKKALQIGITIEKMEIMLDHVHLFVRAHPRISPHKIVQQFKGYTSRILREEFKMLRTRLPTLWTRSYYLESVGHISEDTVKKYIENQKKV
jgi:putative transposase